MKSQQSKLGESASRCFLTAAWRHLLMLNYVVDADILRPRIPAGLSLDTWRGRALVSLVGFHFLDTRLRGVRVPCHRRFAEVNLRFYVTRTLPDGVRRGVTFVREVVPKRAVALVARRVYNEPYVALPMRSEIAMPDASNGGCGRIEYGWRPYDAWFSISAEFAGTPTPLVKESEAEFIAEHYWGYGRGHDGRTLEYQVAHPSWSAWTAVNARFVGDAARFYGPEFAEALSGPPSSAFVADGSAVEVYRGVPLAAIQERT